MSTGDAPLLPLDELVERARRALSTGYRPVPNGRVRDLPDRRAVRWYASIGLIDRPSVMRGRIALYGRRQLLQLVAVKRRQAQGRTLAEIQAELAGATDADLAALARVPAELLAGGEVPPDQPTRPRFWLDRPVAAGDPDPESTPPPNAGSAASSAASLDARTATPASPAGAEPAARLVAPARETGTPEGAVHGITLGGGAVLLLPPGTGAPDPARAAAIRAAAAPLLGLLTDRHDSTDGSDHSEPREGQR